MSIVTPILAFAAFTGSGFGLWTFTNEAASLNPTTEPSQNLESAVEADNLTVILSDNMMYVDETRNYFSGFELTVKCDISMVEGISAGTSSDSKIQLDYSFYCIMENIDTTNTHKCLNYYIESGGVSIASRKYDPDQAYTTTTVNGSTVKVFTVHATASVKENEATAKLYPYYLWVNRPSDNSEFKEFNEASTYTKFKFHVELNSERIGG